MSEPTPRQVLYALVAGGFLLVVAVLVIGAAVAGLVPGWWTGVMAIGLFGFSIWGVVNWRRTWSLLLGSIGLFVLWTIGTLIVA